MTSALSQESLTRKSGRELRVPAAGTWGQAVGEEARVGLGPGPAGDFILRTKGFKQGHVKAKFEYQKVIPAGVGVVGVQGRMRGTC